MGAKEECVKERFFLVWGGGSGGGGACFWITNEFLSSEKYYYNDKTIDFSTSSVMLRSGLKIHHH